VEHLKLKIMLGFLLSPPQPNKPENKLPQFSLLILLERDEWFKSFHFEKWEDINTLDYVPVPAVPLLHKFSWIF